MRKFLVLALLFILPLGVFAETSTTTDTDTIITQMKAILDQYGARVKALEVENNILRNEMMKAGIKIPLSAYSGAIVGGIATTTVTSTSTGTSSATGITISSGTVISGEAIATIAKQYSPRYASFIGKIQSDWTAIISAYKMPQGAYIGGYEFVKKGNDDHVFVDIIYTGSTASGIYDAKILYQYHTGTYQRKLIGFFEYNKSTGYYITRTGANPFAGVSRTIIANPGFTSVISQATSSVSSPATSVPATQDTSSITTTTLAEVEKAYSDKRYLTTISLSTAYLQNNPATLDILRIRYRTFFIIGKYSESLAEIAKIEAIGKLEKAIACDAQVIATYSKTQSLVDKYTKICKS